MFWAPVSHKCVSRVKTTAEAEYMSKSYFNLEVLSSDPNKFVKWKFAAKFIAEIPVF